MSAAITVTLNTGLNIQHIDHIHAIERALDLSLLGVGYTRGVTSKSGESVTFTTGNAR